MLEWFRVSFSCCRLVPLTCDSTLLLSASGTHICPTPGKRRANSKRKILLGLAGAADFLTLNVVSTLKKNLESELHQIIVGCRPELLVSVKLCRRLIWVLIVVSHPVNGACHLPTPCNICDYLLLESNMMIYFKNEHTTKIIIRGIYKEG